VIRLRDAQPDDARTIARLLIQTKEESIPQLIDNHDRDLDLGQERWLRYLRDGSTAQKSRGDGFGILAESASDPIGFAAYHHTYRWDCDAELQSLYVRLPWQRQGVGSTLLREVMRQLRAEGSRSLCVGFSSDNPYKRFYFKHGAVAINPHWAFWAAMPWDSRGGLEMGQTGDS
jgi:GNAT superfamily N-acetyltransferase